MIKPLTSLRFIFSIMVLLSHCSMLSPFYNAHVFQEGFVGVSFFFVLSGFIISYSYNDKLKNKTISNKQFWVARIARIYPLHVLTLFVSIFIFASMMRNPISFLAHLIPNIFLFQSFIPNPTYYYSFNAPSWSLCCEMFFYFLFPFLIFKLNSIKKILIFLLPLMIVTLIGMYFTPEDQTTVNTIWYVNPISRLTDFLIGIFLFFIFRKLKRVKINYKIGSLLELFAISTFIIFYLYSDSFSIVYRASAYYWFPVSLVILSFALEYGIISKILSHKCLIYLGEISFGIYMIHFLVIKVLQSVIHKTNIHLAPFILFLILFTTTFVLSSLSYKYFETPMNRKVKSIFK